MSDFVLNVVRAQVNAVLREIDRLEGSEFPYEHSKDALDEIRQLFRDHQSTLSLLSDTTDKATVELTCNTAFASVKGSLDILGFILRSTNVRNAFEVYGPFLSMAQKLLGPETKLLLSSEWSFSPFTFIGYQYLPGYVLIGLPATESANPLLLPLAGHELGHSVWQTMNHESLKQTVVNSILESIKRRWAEYVELFPLYKKDDLNTNIFAQQTWTPAWNWAMRQAEESFCDFLGLRVFGESYVHASAYMLAPWRAGRRPEYYPNTMVRAQSLVTAAKAYGILNMPKDYIDLFKDLDGPPDAQRHLKFLSSLADEARLSVENMLIKDADNIVTKSGMLTSSADGIQKCLQAFALSVPAQDVDSLPSILNAAWKAYLEPIGELCEHRSDFLSEVVLKNIEVFEIEKRLAE